MNKFEFKNIAVTVQSNIIAIENIKNQKEIAVLDVSKFAGLVSTLDPIQRFGSLVLQRKIVTTASAHESFTCEKAENGVKIIGSFADSESSPFEIFIADTAGKTTINFKNEKYSELRVCIKTDKSEKIFGFGEQFSNVEFSGKHVELCTKEQGIFRGKQPFTFLIDKVMGKGVAGDEFSTYAPMPVFVTSKMRGFSFTGTTIYHFDVKKANACEILGDVMSSDVTFDIFSADSPFGLLESVTAETGRLSPLPDFAYDTILGVRGGRPVVDKILSQCEKHCAPVKAIWIEDWQGRRGKNGGPPLWWRWYPDEILYPNFKTWAGELKEKGIALLGYANPFLSADAEKNTLYVEALEKGYLVKKADGEVWDNHFVADVNCRYVHVDLTNPEAYSWLKEKMRVGMIENGLSGWMADYGEYLPLGTKSFHENDIEAHAMIPVLWAKLNHELLVETGNQGKFLIFHRSAGAGSNKYATAYWAGDQNPTFDEYDGLASSVCGLISSGLSGMTINHTDIGGFTTIITKHFKLVRSKEVMFRWLEYAAFTPVFRTHDGAFANPLNYQFYYDDEGYAFYAKMGRLHSSLKWYLKELEREAVEKGIPMVRSLWIHYPEDAICTNLTKQYLLGEDILVAPVCKKGGKTVKVYIPKGVWISPYNGEKINSNGEWETIPAILGFPPVLIRSESEKCEKIVNTICGSLFGDA
ncbi:MAG: alpha-glucosidase [Bacillota bacterium]